MIGPAKTALMIRITGFLLLFPLFQIFASGNGEMTTMDGTAVAQATGFKVLNQENSVVANNIHFSWIVKDPYLEVQVFAPTNGWVAVGFNPSMIMKDADIKIGYVKDGMPVIRDDFSDKLTAHGPDEGFGGEDQIEIIEAEENNDGTMLHFRFPLKTGDEYDHQFVLGETIPVIFAYGRGDDFRTLHSGKGKAKISF